MSDDVDWMRQAIDLSRRCPPSTSAFSVGAIIVADDGAELARGFSRETDPHVHAEESALSKLPENDPRLADATLYSTLEPCSQRRSRPRTCTDLILSTKLPRIVIAWREPPLLVDDCIGYELLHNAGVTVIELEELVDDARAVNAHLLGARDG